MKRDPSIHVKKSDLVWILNEFNIEPFSEDDINRIVTELRRCSCDNRAVSITNDKVKKDVTKILSSKKSDSLLLSDILYSTRIKLKHKGVKKINESDRDWLQLKSLTKLVNQFCIDFELSKRDGYIKYVELAFSKISSIRSYISKFINMYESICIDYDSCKEVENDTKPELTKKVHDLFVNKIADKTGIQENLLNKPDKMIHFYKARLLCDSLGVDYSTFIDAQFDALDWCNGVPYPESLTNEKSKERLNKYLFENNITINQPNKKEFWDKLKTTTV